LGRKGHSILINVLYAANMNSSDKRTILRLFLDAGVDISVCNDSGMSLLMRLLHLRQSSSIRVRVPDVMPDYVLRILICDILDHVISNPYTCKALNDARHTSTISNCINTGAGAGSRPRGGSSSRSSQTIRPMPDGDDGPQRRRPRR
jgi:hypothetical protein